jgi:prophage regulatory protein
MPVSERIIRLPTVLNRTGLSRSTLYRKIAEGTFPAQVQISVHGAGWWESAINRWIADPPGYRAENDNSSELAPAAVDAALTRIAEAIGRHIAREHVRARTAANDNDLP